MMTLRRPPKRGFQGNPFTPAELFRGGVNGVWFDPSDLGTLYQNAAGTIPVTAADQPVGLMLDKSVLTGHDARRNLLTYTEQFDNSAWLKTNNIAAFGSGSIANAAIAPDGTLTADKLADTTTNGFHYVYQLFSLTGGTTYRFSVYLKAAGRNYASLNLPIAPNTWAGVDLTTGALTTINGSPLASCTNVGNGWFRLSIQGTRAVTQNAEIQILMHNSNSFSVYAGDGASGIYIWGAQLEIGSTATTYQKVTTGLGDWTPGNHASQATDAKRPMLRTDGRLWWLEFDGVDDYLECATFPVLDMRSVSCVFSAAQALFQPWGEVFCLKANNSWPYNDGLSFQALSEGVFPNTSCGFSGTALSYSDDLATSLSVPRLAVPFTDMNKRVVYSIFSSPSTKVTYYNNNRINSLAGAFTSGSLLPGILFGAIYTPSGEIASGASAGSMKLHDFVLVEKTIEQAQITKYIAIKSGVTL